MNISLLIAMLCAIRDENGPDSEILIEVQEFDNDGCSYHLAASLGVRFNEGARSVTLFGEQG